MRLYAFIAGLVIFMGAALAFMARSHQGETLTPRPEMMFSAYGRLVPGVTRASQLPRLGVNTMGAVRLSYLSMVEAFTPRNSFDFDVLEPAVRDCLQARDRCDAFIFALADRPGTRALVLIADGRVTYKSLSHKILMSGNWRASRN
jgi:hypothetical protein